jgi:hypothetical protein
MAPAAALKLFGVKSQHSQQLFSVLRVDDVVLQLLEWVMKL